MHGFDHGVCNILQMCLEDTGAGQAMPMGYTLLRYDAHSLLELQALQFTGGAMN
jgi:hypothetical protein